MTPHIFTIRLFKQSVELFVVWVVALSYWKNEAWVFLYLGTWSKSVTACLTAVEVHDPKNMMDSVITFILVINQLDEQNLLYNKFTSSLYMFRAHVLIVRRSKLYYTASGIITPVGFRPVLSQSVHGTATCRCDDTRDCVIQFCPPDDEHMCAKHVEAWNKLITKFSASSWLILRNKYIEMHGQQNTHIKISLICLQSSASFV